MMRRIDRSLENPDCGHDCLDRTMDRVKRMRRCGLEDGGEFSTENLAFKILRRNGYLARLSEQRRLRLDRELSLPPRVAARWLLGHGHASR